jgi:amino acid transporter
MAVGTVVKRVLVGRQVSSSKLEHTLLPKVLALPVFSSDALSSVAYATEEILIVLVGASLAARSLVFPIAIAISVLMAIVVVSYRQTVRAYPSGGGAYIVSRENLGIMPGLIAAAALLTDYVLTVAVSVAAGVYAITSAAPELGAHRVILSLGFVALITLANLRGVRESGTLFAIPTYAFIISIFALVITGLVKCATQCPVFAGPEHPLPIGMLASVGIFRILHAFSSGSTALTGVEAISNGVPAFRRPQARNAAETLAIMGVISIAMFLGISWLAFQIHGVVPSHEQSVVSQIASAVFGGGLGFYLVQILTAAILILAANTAYQDFPRLSAILARDSFVPRQFQNRGDRLVFSNGVIVLATFAGLLIWVFDAEVNRLIQLYVVGVFTSFTLSQTGMVRHWFKLRGSGWRRSAVINGIGAAATGVVLIVIASTKFIHGAWIVIAAMPVIVSFFLMIRRHYERVRSELVRGDVRFGEVGSNRVVFVLTDVDAAAAEALGYVRAMRPESFQVVYVGKRPLREAQSDWRSLDPSGPDPVDGSAGDAVDNVMELIRRIPREPRDFVTVVIPEMFRKRSLLQALTKRVTFRLKVRLLSEPGVVIADVPVLAERGQLVGVDGLPLIPERIVALVFVGSVHDATVRAVNYAQTLNAHETRAIFLATEPEETPGFLQAWVDRGIAVPLDIVEAPFRDLGPPLVDEVRRVTADPGSVAVVVLPEFLVTKPWHRLLHNNRALFVKRQLLFEPRVILSSVPYQLGRARERENTRRWAPDLSE